MDKNDVRKILTNGDEGFDFEIVKEFFFDCFNLNSITRDIINMIEDEDALEDYILETFADTYKRKILIDEWGDFITKDNQDPIVDLR